MKKNNLIYQYWDGPMRPAIQPSIDSMIEYASRIGAQHLFEHNPQWIKKQGKNFGKYTPHYGQFKIVYDDFFDNYDDILFVDADVYVADNVTENIFEDFYVDIGICEEPEQPYERAKSTGQISKANDEKWAKEVAGAYIESTHTQPHWRVTWNGQPLPRNKDGLLKVFNSGVVLYSYLGRQKLRARGVEFQSYINEVRQRGLPLFYMCDQPYLHAMMYSCDLDIKYLDNEWNRIVHYTGSGNPRPIYDERTKDTKFVHIQLSSADDFEPDLINKIVNSEPGTIQKVLDAESKR